MSAKSNKTTLSFAVEDSIGVLPTTPDWYNIERNDLSTFGASISTVSRNPVSQDLMEQEGAVSDLDSAVGFQTDLTISAFNNFAQGMFYSVWKAQTEFTPTAVTTTGYTVASGGDLPAGTLVYAKNFSNSENNGLKITTTSTVSTEIEVTTTLVAESSPPDGATVTVAGVQGTAGDIQIDSDGNLISTTLDFTTLGLQVGQSIYIGGSTTDTQFATTDYKGLARVRIIEANKLTLDKRDWTVGSADDGSGKTIQIFIGSFIRNVPQNHTDFLEETYTFEGKIEGMDEGTVYEYPKGNKLNTAAIEFPLTDKAGISYEFVGLDTPSPTSSQAAGNRLETYDHAAFGTTSDFARLSLKDSAFSDYTTRFKSLTLNINRNVSPEKALANLGAVDMNTGTLVVEGSASVIYNDSDIIAATRNNETTTLDIAINNNDGCLHFDIPSMKFAATNKSFPVNESVLVDVTMKTFKDSFFGYVISCTKYPYLPV